VEEEGRVDRRRRRRLLLLSLPHLRRRRRRARRLESPFFVFASIFAAVGRVCGWGGGEVGVGTGKGKTNGERLF
jgi:hypothetical protein